MNLIFVECGLVLLKYRGVFIKLSSIEFMWISLKFRAFFILSKFRGVVHKITISRVRIDFVKVQEVCWCTFARRFNSSSIHIRGIFL